MNQNLPISDVVMSIGAVSRATGIPVDTLRTWERRYGFPSPARTDGGHRKYAASVIAQLKLIHAAIERGYRPANVVSLSADALHTLLQTGEPDEAAPPAPPVASAPGELLFDAQLAACMAATERMDAEELGRCLERGWYRLGAMAFLDKLLAPFIEAIGHAWYEGRLAVLHEQFASNQLRKFLLNHWQPISARARGPRVVCATLPGEFHALGLHMIAVVMALVGCQVVFVGCDASPQEIADAVAAHQASATLISVSAAASDATTRLQLNALRAALPATHPLLVGGAGAPRDLDGVTVLRALPELERWARDAFLDAAP